MYLTNTKDIQLYYFKIHIKDKRILVVDLINLSKVYTKCLEEETVRPDWKCTNVTTIFKKGGKRPPGNYRLVS